MRDRFDEQNISSFDIRKDKNRGMKQDVNLRSVSVHSVIHFKRLAPQDIFCNATVFLDSAIDKIPPETKITITITISDLSNLSSGYSNIKSEIFTFNKLNTIYPMAVGATVLLYNKRQSIVDLPFRWLEGHGWEGRHAPGHDY